jgi:isoleucyl-tRNA synthetase
VNLGRNLREQGKLPVRQPLPRLVVAFRDGSSDADHGRLQDPALLAIVADELNVKAVELDPAGAGHLVETSARLNFKVAAKRLGGKTKDVAAAVAAWNSDAARSWQIALQDGPVEVPTKGAPEWLQRDDIEFRVAPKPGHMVATEGTLTVELDAALTPALVQEGLAREVVNRVQNARKDAGLAVEDRIALALWTDSADVRAAVDAFSGYVAGETLALTLEWRERVEGLQVTDLAPGKRLALAVR